MPGWLVVTLWTVGGIVVLVVAIGLLLPRPFEISRSVVIAAPPEKIHPLLDSFANWPRWSPFDTEIESIRFELQGPLAGVGATRTWTSREMGAGRQSIVASDPRKGISMKFEAAHIEHLFEIAFAPEDGGTRVTWSDRGEFPAAPHWRVVGHLFIDRMLGGMFARGLAALKREAEAQTSPPAS